MRGCSTQLRLWTPKNPRMFSRIEHRTDLAQDTPACHPYTQTCHEYVEKCVFQGGGWGGLAGARVNCIRWFSELFCIYYYHSDVFCVSYSYFTPLFPCYLSCPPLQLGSRFWGFGKVSLAVENNNIRAYYTMQLLFFVSFIHGVKEISENVNCLQSDGTFLYYSS